MATTVSRKSTKKCPRGKVARRSHMRMGRRVKAACVKKTKARKMRKMSKTRKTVDRKRVVAMFYPDRAPITIGDLMNMYSKSKFLEAVNDPIEPEERAEKGFKPEQSFTEIVNKLMTFGGATINVRSDKMPFPEGQSRIVFMNA